MLDSFQFLNLVNFLPARHLSLEKILNMLLLVDLLRVQSIGFPGLCFRGEASADGQLLHLLLLIAEFGVQKNLLLDLRLELLLLVGLHFLFSGDLIFILLDFEVVVLEMVAKLLAVLLQCFFVAVQCLLQGGALSGIMILNNSKVLFWLDILRIEQLLHCSRSSLAVDEGARA